MYLEMFHYDTKVLFEFQGPHLHVHCSDCMRAWNACKIQALHMQVLFLRPTTCFLPPLIISYPSSPLYSRAQSPASTLFFPNILNTSGAIGVFHFNAQFLFTSILFIIVTVISSSSLTVSLALASRIHPLEAFIMLLPTSTHCGTVLKKRLEKTLLSVLLRHLALLHDPFYQVLQTLFNCLQMLL